MKLSLRKADLVVVGSLSVALVLLLHHTRSFAPPLLEGYPGDAFFPRLVLGFTLFWGLVIILRRVSQLLMTDLSDDEPPFELDGRAFAVMAAAIVGYAVLLMPVGFEITTALFLTGLLIPRYGVVMTGGRAVVWAAAVAVSSVAVTWLVFVILLNVDLPLLFLPRYLSF